MKDYASIPNTDGAFPDVVSRNVTTPGAGDGTPITTNVVDDIWGFFQAVLSEAGTTPSGDSEAHDESQLLDGIRAICVDGLVGGEYSPSAKLIWNNQLEIVASGGTGTNLDALTATGKGNKAGGVFIGGSVGGAGITATGGSATGAGVGGVFYGMAAATGGSGARGIESYGGNAVTSGAGGVGAYITGGNGAGADGDGAVGAYCTGGTKVGTGEGGSGVRGKGGLDTGIGGVLSGYGTSWAGTAAKQGAVILGGSGGADALWAITATGAEPTSPAGDTAIWASTGGAYPAAAIIGRSDLGVGLSGITYDGIACLLGAIAGTGSPLRIVPKSAAPTTNLASGCFYIDSDDGTVRHYEGSDWYIIPDAKSTAIGGGSGSAGAGKQYIELRFGAATYKVLHDGTV